MNRVRGPFNVGSPAQAAGIAALEDVEHQERSRAHNERWLPWLAARAQPPRPDGAPEPRQLRPGRVRGRGRRRSAAAASAWLERGASSRARWRPTACPLPAAVGRARGREPAPWSRAWRLRRRERAADAAALRRVALIGIGLINGSLALVLRAEARGRDRGLRAHRGDAREGAGARPRRPHHPSRAPRCAGADLVVIGMPPAGGRRGRRGDGAGLAPRRS